MNGPNLGSIKAITLTLTTIESRREEVVMIDTTVIKEIQASTTITRDKTWIRPKGEKNSNNQTTWDQTNPK
jgi:hypothetical protein